MSFSMTLANPDGDFAGHDLRTLPRNDPHTIKFFMRLVPGADNDLVRILIDGERCWSVLHDLGELLPGRFAGRADQRPLAVPRRQQGRHIA